MKNTENTIRYSGSNKIVSDPVNGGLREYTNIEKIAVEAPNEIRNDLLGYLDQNVVDAGIWMIKKMQSRRDLTTAFYRYLTTFGSHTSHELCISTAIFDASNLYKRRILSEPNTNILHGGPSDTNLYLWVVAPSGYGKSTSIKKLADLIRGAELEANTGYKYDALNIDLAQASSSAALQTKLAKYPVMSVQVDEFDKAIEAVSNSKSDYKTEIMQIIYNSCNNSPITVGQVKKDALSDPLSVPHGSLSMYGACTPSGLDKVYNMRNFSQDGFISRFIIIEHLSPATKEKLEAPTEERIKMAVKWWLHYRMRGKSSRNLLNIGHAFTSGNTVGFNHHELNSENMETYGNLPIVGNNAFEILDHAAAFEYIPLAEKDRDYIEGFIIALSDFNFELPLKGSVSAIYTVYNRAPDHIMRLATSFAVSRWVWEQSEHTNIPNEDTIGPEITRGDFDMARSVIFYSCAVKRELAIVKRYTPTSSRSIESHTLTEQILEFIKSQGGSVKGTQLGRKFRDKPAKDNALESLVSGDLIEVKIEPTAGASRIIYKLK